MVKSMTGYGRYKELIGGKDITVEIRSVNSRYLDANVKVSRLYGPLEEKLKRMISKYVSRAKVDLYVGIDNIEGEKIELSLNREYLEGFLGALNTVKNEYNVHGEIDISTVASKNEVFIQRRLEDDMNELWCAVETVAAKAFELYDGMRTREGDSLVNDLLSRIETIDSIRSRIAERVPKVVSEYNEKLRKRIEELLCDVKVDEQRLLTECAVFADKADVTEELTRLSSHVDQFKKILSEEDQVGRKLDFLVQEINREVNTCGSKANDNDIAKLVIEAKCEIEKIREQIQNLE
ncbi:MAG: YicC family protein [Clostridia bacterium]|nr:YicC family protein [Clostridia bacterium]